MKRFTTLTGAFVIALAALMPAAAAQPRLPEDIAAEVAAAKSSSVYLVLLDDAPVVAYEGDLPGLAATRAAEGTPDPESGVVRRYETHLRREHARALSDVGAPADAAIHEYTFALNGFAATLTEEQASLLALRPGVLGVFPDQLRRVTSTNDSSTTDASAQYLELDHPQGPWATGYTGADVVIGVIDTGIWPEHPSFADDGTYGAAPEGFTGTACEFGSEVDGAATFNPADADFACNGKLLSARVYGEGFHGGTGNGLAPGEYLSARDADGHGSHTAGTAAGNADVPASVLDQEWGTVSGVAPRARLAVYKACWSENPGEGLCALADLVAAIDQAVADGVDVINYSIGLDDDSFSPDSLAFLFAADAGVAVATSAGNDGPDASTVGAPSTSPWVTSVGAATQSRNFAGTLLLGTDLQIEGVTLTPGTGALPLVDAADLGNELCDPSVSFTGSVADAIVLCRRGGVARVAKSQAVDAAGGAGMVLANTLPDDSLNTDNHYVPSLHISAEDGEVVAAYIADNENPLGLLSGGTRVDAQGHVLASFSSRGPNGFSSDILKPDVIAPGVNILAAATPTALLGAPGEMFQAISGTSMSSPHVAGVYALLRQARPDWTPAMAKSALVTTASHDVYLEDAETPAKQLEIGGGYIRPGGRIHLRGSAFNPGLVYDANLFDYAAFTCGADLDWLWQPGTCALLEEFGYSTDPSDLNVPAIAIGELVGSQTVTRTVTSVADKLRTFESRVVAPPGFDVVVEPETLTLAPGESAEFSVTFTRTRGTLGEWASGSLRWHTNGYRVDTPIVVRGFEFATDTEVSGAGVEGSALIDVRFGYDGSYSATPHGLVAATVAEGTLANDAVAFHTVQVPDESRYVRVALSDEYTSGDDDLDIYVFDPSNNYVDGSFAPGSDEEVSFVPTVGGTYTVMVHAWQTEGPETDYSLFSWAVPEGAAGFSVAEAPAAATANTTGTVSVAWSGLAADTMYLGTVTHTGPDGELAVTVVGVDTSVAGTAAAPASIVLPREDDVPSARGRSGDPDRITPAERQRAG